MHAEQQRFWIALLNLHRTWADDDAALAFVPPRHRDFERPPDWPWPKAQAYLLNNLDLLRDSHARLEAGRPIEADSFNLVLAECSLRLRVWPRLEDLHHAVRAKAQLGSRVEALQVTSDAAALNPGTRYVRHTLQRAFYYFALYADHRLSDPRYPEVSPERWHVPAEPDAHGDLRLVEPRAVQAVPREAP